MLKKDSESTGSNQLDTLRNKVTVVIPTLNEAEAIGPLLKEVLACRYQNVLVVDGYSTDGTDGMANRLGARVVMQHGKGKAGAVLTAREVVDTPYFLLMDGDYSYDPRDIDRFLEFMDGYDHIIGYRPKGSSNISLTHKLGNWILTKWFNMLMGSSIPDVCSGMYLLRTEKLKQITLDKHGFVVDQEIAAQTLLDGRLTYIPISYRSRRGRAKAPTWRQGFTALLTIFQLARDYNPVLLFSTFASSALVPSLILFIWFIYRYIFFSLIHSTYLLISILLAVLGALGLTVATIATMLRRMERKLMGLNREMS